MVCSILHNFRLSSMVNSLWKWKQVSPGSPWVLKHSWTSTPEQGPAKSLRCWVSCPRELSNILGSQSWWYRLPLANTIYLAVLWYKVSFSLLSLPRHGGKDTAAVRTLIRRRCTIGSPVSMKGRHEWIGIGTVVVNSGSLTNSWAQRKAIPW